jgi:hypothetical protein
MTCHQVQTNLSLYLYAELPFDQEEALEQHLEECAFCQRTLAREKELHARLNAERRDVSFELLSECRRDLRTAVEAEKRWGQRIGKSNWRAWFSAISATRWSSQLAMASFLVFAGFMAARLVDSGRIGGFSAGSANEMGLINPENARVRDIQRAGDHDVRIVLDRVQQQEVTGSLNDVMVRHLLLAAMQDSNDPGIRVYSVQMLQHDSGDDVRDALLASANRDSNAAVRIKALEGLRQFTTDRTVRVAIESIVKHDASPEVRSEAIDVLLASQSPVPVLTPDILKTLQDVLSSEREDDYVRSRSAAVLRAVGAPSPVY